MNKGERGSDSLPEAQVSKINKGGTCADLHPEILQGVRVSEISNGRRGECSHES
jgi:hypothetical protein